MRNKIQSLFFLAVLVLTTIPPASSADEGSGRIKLGYINIDEEGNLAVNQETFNLDEPVQFAIENFRYLMDNGINVNADLRNIPLRNRDLDFSVRKARLFSISLHNDKYRRVYQSDGSKSTERETYGAKASMSPSRYVKFFGEFKRIDRKGTDIFQRLELSDPLVMNSDYVHRTYNIGGQGYYKKSRLRFEYTRTHFDDYAHEESNREADNFRLSAATALPRLERIVLSGGYDYRLDKLEFDPTRLKTNQGWGAARVYLPDQFSLDYRLVFARTKHEIDEIETDNVLNTISIAKIWKRRGGLRVGYESRIADDLTDRSESNGFLFNSWFNYKNRLFLKALLTTRDKNIVTGSTLVGNEDFNRYLATIKYADPRWGDLSASYKARIRENKDISSRIDYNSFSTKLRITREKLGDFTITYAYYKGKYKNRTDEFQFSDHVVTGFVTPVKYKNVGLSAGGTYYRSQRDLDIEKFSLNFQADYSLSRGYHVEAKYDVYNFDNFHEIGSYYTGNIVQVNFIKDFSI